jgi:hypothetical protein
VIDLKKVKELVNSRDLIEREIHDLTMEEATSVVFNGRRIGLLPPHVMKEMQNRALQQLRGQLEENEREIGRLIGIEVVGQSVRSEPRYAARALLSMALSAESPDISLAVLFGWMAEQAAESGNHAVEATFNAIESQLLSHEDTTAAQAPGRHPSGGVLGDLYIHESNAPEEQSGCVTPGEFGEPYDGLAELIFQELPDSIIRETKDVHEAVKAAAYELNKQANEIGALSDALDDARQHLSQDAIERAHYLDQGLKEKTEEVARLELALRDESTLRKAAELTRMQWQDQRDKAFRDLAIDKDRAEKLEVTNMELETRIEELEHRNANQLKVIEEMEARISALEAQEEADRAVIEQTKKEHRERIAELEEQIERADRLIDVDKIGRP